MEFFLPSAQSEAGCRLVVEVDGESFSDTLSRASRILSNRFGPSHDILTRSLCVAVSRHYMGGERTPSLGQYLAASDADGGLAIARLVYAAAKSRDYSDCCDFADLFDGTQAPNYTLRNGVSPDQGVRWLLCWAEMEWSYNLVSSEDDGARVVQQYRDVLPVCPPGEPSVILVEGTPQPRYSVDAKGFVYFKSKLAHKLARLRVAQHEIQRYSILLPGRVSVMQMIGISGTNLIQQYGDIISVFDLDTNPLSSSGIMVGRSGELYARSYLRWGGALAGSVAVIVGYVLAFLSLDRSDYGVLAASALPLSSGVFGSLAVGNDFGTLLMTGFVNVGSGIPFVGRDSREVAVECYRANVNPYKENDCWASEKQGGCIAHEGYRRADAQQGRTHGNLWVTPGGEVRELVRTTVPGTVHAVKRDGTEVVSYVGMSWDSVSLSGPERGS